MSKSIIIIGAGVAGLSAGTYGQLNGYDTQIFELHDLPGGLCTAWKRKGYTFDGCIHWLVGSSPKTEFHRIWQELGVTQGRKMIDHEEFLRIEGSGGKTLIFYTNVDRLEKHLLELAPEDSKLIKELTKTIRNMKMPFSIAKAQELYNFWDKLKMGVKMLPMMGSFIKYGKVSIHEFAERFTNPFLRETFPKAFDMPGFPLFGMMMTFSWMNIKAAGYPIGGSLEFAQAIESRYLSLGGKINYRARVAKILVENDRAVGVKLVDGSEHRADIVISAADGHATIFDMLEGKYVNEEIRGYYEKMPIFKPIIQVSLGIARDFSNEPVMSYRRLQSPINICGEMHERIGFKHYAYDPTMAPEGKTAVVATFIGDYEYWKNLSKEEYLSEKEKLKEEVIRAFEQLYPGISQQIEVVDVATPLTYERYTGNWQGSMEGWLITTETMMMQMKKTLPGLQNFYMIGQWLAPGGGLPPAAQHGRDIIQVICAKEKRRFTAPLPEEQGSILKQNVGVEKSL